MKKIGLLWLIVVLGISNSSAQQKLLSKSYLENGFNNQDSIAQDMEKLAAIEFANKNKLPVRIIEKNGTIKEIRRINNNQPEYLITHNVTAAKSVSSFDLWDGKYQDLVLDGDGILAAVWDGGNIRTSHIEFGGRVYTQDAGFEIVGHATHVAGTMGATGVDPDARGMANQLTIAGYDWDNDNNEMRVAAERGLLLSNHSYGLIQGFHYSYSQGRWEWYGDTDISETEDYKFGIYGSDSRQWDDISYDNPYYLIVKSAGNDRLEGPGAGAVHYIYNGGWKASNQVRAKDGDPEGFDCIGSQATAKNIMTVGAVNDIEDGYQVPEDVVETDFTAYGPTDDGRIKPDIVGNGHGVYSPYFQNNTDYASLNGTSMSSPSVTGSMALLQELYFEKFNEFMKSATLKGLVLHSADDAGNVGPDYKFGWGLMNTKSAADIIYFSDTHQSAILEDSILEDKSKVYTLYQDEGIAGKATICWTDPHGDPPSASLDPSDLMLVNDLDMRIKKSGAGQEYAPFILTPETPDLPATTGDNFRDNIEQIELPEEKGFYQLSVSHKDDLKDSVQYFSLIINGTYPVFLASEYDTLNDNNGELMVTTAPVCPSNSQFSWLIEPENSLPIFLTFDAFNTDLSDIVKVYDGSNSSSALLAEFSGSTFNFDTAISSSSGSLFIEFSTQNNSTSKGFSASYCTSEPGTKPVIYGTAIPCIGDSEKYSTDVAKGTQYNWSLSSPLIDSTMLGIGCLDIVVPANAFTIAVEPYNNCGIGESTVFSVLPAATAPDLENMMTGDTVPCTNTQNSYSVEHDDYTMYNWILPENWQGSSDSSTIWVNALEEKGPIMVVPYNSCGNDDTIKIEVKGKSIPRKPSILADRISPCQNSFQECYIQAEEEIDYKWEVDQNWSIMGPDTLNRVTLLVGETLSGTVSVNTSNKCGNTIAERKYNFSPFPLQPDIILQESSVSGYEEILLENFDDFSTVSWILNDSVITEDKEVILVQRNGEYSIEVTNTDGCTRSLDIQERINIDEKKLLFSVYSGNIRGQFIVVNDSPTDALMEGFDIMGKALFSVNIVPGENYFNSPVRGILILKISGTDLTKSQLIILP